MGENTLEQSWCCLIPCWKLNLEFVQDYGNSTEIMKGTSYYMLAVATIRKLTVQNKSEKKVAFLLLCKLMNTPVNRARFQYSLSKHNAL